MKKYMSIALLAGALAMSGCGSSNGFNEVSGLQGNPGGGVFIGPICLDDNYATNQNATLTVNATNGVLANDTPNGGTVTGFSATSTQGGTVAVNPDGSFTYTPANNFTGGDAFTYTVTNGFGSTTCTVNITVNAAVVVDGFFVDAATGNDATGSFTGGNPFATIQGAVTAAGTNQDIVVRPGTYSGNVTLLNGQRLLGSGSVLAQGTAPRPVLNGGGITLADGNTVDYIRIQGTPGDAIFGNGVNGATITNCEIADTTNNGSGIQDDNATGTWTIEGNAITNVASIGVLFRGSSGDDLVAMANNNTITGSGNGGVAFSYSGTGTVRAQVTGNTMTGTVITGRTFEVNATDNAELCFDITGNTNDDGYSFARLPATAVIQVEELNDLLSINSGSAILDNPSAPMTFPAVEVPDNHCMFGN
jgi:Big-like domain-containing protein